MTAMREAFDLFHPACRQNFRRALRRSWRRAQWWALVFADTRNRVCSAPKARGERP